jgi:hypothetical protein
VSYLEKDFLNALSEFQGETQYRSTTENRRRDCIHRVRRGNAEPLEA